MSSGASFVSSITSGGTYVDSMISVNVCRTICWSKQCVDRKGKSTYVGHQRGVYDLRREANHLPGCLLALPRITKGEQPIGASSICHHAECAVQVSRQCDRPCGLHGK